MQQKYLALNLVHRKYVAFLIIYTFSCEKVTHEEVKNLYGDPWNEYSFLFVWKWHQLIVAVYILELYLNIKSNLS